MPMLVDIDPHGRVAPQDDEARRALADRAGRFALLPAAADLLVARRTPPAGGNASPPRCAVAGDISAFPIADFVSFVHQSRVSGKLTVSAGGLERVVTFRDGEVRSAQSDAVGERLGEVALRLGYLDEARLGEAIEGGRPIGAVLVERGLLTPAELRRCLHEQVAAIVHAILLAREGVFFMIDDLDAECTIPLSVNTESLLIDGLRRIDEMSLFRAKIPGPEARLRRREPARPITLKPVEHAILALVDGRRCVAQVASAAHLSELDAVKILYHLADAGYLEAAADPNSSEEADAASRVEAIADGMNGVLREIAATAAGSQESDSFLLGARAYLADPAAPFAPLFEGVPVGADGALDRAVLLGRLGSLDAGALPRLGGGGDSARLLFDALRDLVCFYLLQARERLTRDADDALGREVKARIEPLEALR